METKATSIDKEQNDEIKVGAYRAIMQLRVAASTEEK